MKTYLTALFITATFFISTKSTAQPSSMGSMMGYGRPGYGNTGAMDRSIGRTQYSNGKKKTENKKVDLLEDSLNFLEKELMLDTFQKTVVKEMLENNKKEETKVISEDIPDDSKIEKIAILRNKLDEKIKTMLSKEQVDLFIKMKDKLDKKRS